MPDVIANLRVDQAWGFAGVSVAIHDASGAYYGTANNVNNGHPADKLGWAVAVGGQLNLPAAIRSASTSPATRKARPAMHQHRHRHADLQRLDQRRRRLADRRRLRHRHRGRADPGVERQRRPTSTSGTRNGRRRGSAATSTSTTTTPPRRSSTRSCRVRTAPARARPASEPSSPRSRQPRTRATAAIPTSASTKSARARSGTRCRSSISVSKCSTRTSTPHTRAGDLSGQRLAAGGHPHRRPEHLVRDVPLAAQLLSMIACSIVANLQPPGRSPPGVCVC